MTEISVAESPVPERPASRWRRWRGSALVVGLVCFAAFWVWALFFASKEPINRSATARGRRVPKRSASPPTRSDSRSPTSGRVERGRPRSMLAERADIVDQATDIVEQMLDDVVAVKPTDPKGQDLVPQWEADYRTYIADRRAFTPSLRESGKNLPFYETAVDGIPISEKLEVFAADNHMRDLRPAPRPRPTNRSVSRSATPGCWLLTTLPGCRRRRSGRGCRRVTTLLAPTTTWRPIVAPGSTTVPCPSHDPSPMRPAAPASPAPRSAGRGRRSRGSGR